VQEHADLIDHLARGDAPAAVALMLRHLGANEARLDSERRDAPLIVAP
jgi:DNA-binding GntR family transcriptional regulator